MVIKDFFNKNYTYAIIGASNNPNKYGNRILLDLKQAGYEIIPINPSSKEIEGLRAYKNLSEANKKIDVVIFVVPPHITLEILKNLPSQIKKVWMQPGASNQECIDYCIKNNIEAIHDSCVMIQKNEYK